MSSFFLKIATPDRDFFSGKVEYLSVNTPNGREGFMRGAIAKIAVLSAGKIEITVDGQKTAFTCSDGIICVKSDGISLITGFCRNADEPEVEEQVSSDKEYKFAKAKIASSIKQLRDKNLPDETF